MKFLNALPFLILLPDLGSAAKCGQWFTSDCICDTDIRYCAEGENGASDNILDQHPLWNHLQGFYKFEAYKFTFGLYLGTNTFATDNPYIGYLNHTIIGSRDYQHRYDIFPPLDPAKCAPTPDPFINGLPDFVCGETGVLYFFEGFALSTNERDGSLTTTPSLVALQGSDEDGAYLMGEEDNADYKMVPVDENTLQGSVDSDVFLVTETFVFTNEARTEAGSMQDVYAKAGDQSILVQSTRLELTKIDEESFITGLAADLEANNIVPSIRPDAVPMERSCLNKDCPTEEDFCQLDPKCTVSKYLEPDATVKAGPIVGIVSAVFAVLLAVLYLVHRRAMEKQKERLKNMFAKHVVQSLKIGIGASGDFFSMEALQEEFKRIDVGEEGGDGVISKAELRAFMTSGKMGKVTDSDFDTLFGIIDADGSGEVDFIEFATFMGEIKDNIEAFGDDVENQEPEIMDDTEAFEDDNKIHEA
uniref:EF-hand domain-containing protein n=1 Tax=Chaetoceros debilis TaxID=122233 RepID=A0A7S3Q5T8_9STRA